MSVQPQGVQKLALERHETKDANVKWIFGVVGFLFASGIAIHFILAGMLKRLEHTPPTRDQWQPLSRAASQPLPGPRLQVAPASDLAAFRAREEVELNSYGWINRTAGVARIPIERAMNLVLQKGLRTRNSDLPNKAGPSSLELLEQRSIQRDSKTQTPP